MAAALLPEQENFLLLFRRETAAGQQRGVHEGQGGAQSVLLSLTVTQLKLDSVCLLSDGAATTPTAVDTSLPRAAGESLCVCVCVCVVCVWVCVSE